MIDYTVLGKNIRELREDEGISQNDFASAVGISTRRLSSIENGHVDNISLNTISRIAELLNCRISALIGDNAFNEEYPITSSTLQHAIDCTNYLHRNPFRKISTFSQLFLILPLISLEDLFDITFRVHGQIFGNEDYIAQAVGYAYKNIPESDAKSYINTVLELIESTPWEGRSDISASEALQEKDNELMINNPEYVKQYEAYMNAINEKGEAIKALSMFIDAYNSAEYTLMRRR